MIDFMEKRKENGLFFITFYNLNLEIVYLSNKYTFAFLPVLCFKKLNVEY